MPAPMISVVVALTQADDRLTRLIESVDEQSLPLEEFELIMVDRSGAVAVANRLARLRQRRPNVRVVSTAAGTGLAVALNQGIEAAAGRYVLPIGPIDVLLPRSLEEFVRFADQHVCDVVVGRGLGPTRAGLDQTLTGTDRARLDPARHLLGLAHPFVGYRRELLITHRLGYRDQGGLLDRTFHAEVAGRTEAIGVFAGYPLGRGPGLAEAYPLRADPAERAHWWADVCGSWSSLTGPSRSAGAGHPGLTGFMITEVAAALQHRGLDHDQQLAADVLAVLREHCPAAADRALPHPYRLLAGDLRRGEWAAARRILTGLTELEATVTSATAGWVGRSLRVEVSGRVRVGAGIDLRQPELHRLVAEARIVLGVRNRMTAPIFTSPTVEHWTVETTTDESKTPEQFLSFTAETLLDPAVLQVGDWLDEGTWQVVAQLPGLGFDAAPVLPIPGCRVPTMITEDRLIAVVGGHDDTLHLDLGGTTSNGLIGLSAADTEVIETAEGSHLTVRLPELITVDPLLTAADGPELTGSVRLGTLAFPARLRLDPADPRLECYASGLAGDYPIATAIGRGRWTPTGLTLRIGHTGEMVVI